MSETILLPDLDQLWDYDRPAESEKRFRKLLGERDAFRDMAYHIELLTQIARAEGLQGRFDNAHHTLDQVEAMLEDEAEALSAKPRIRYLLERGRAYNSSGSPGLAKPLFLEAWELGRKAGEDSLEIDAAHMMAIVETPEKQLAWNLKGIELARSTSDPRTKKWLGSIYNNIGWNYFDNREYGKALDAFKTALESRERENPVPQGKVRIAKWAVARTLRALDRTSEALEMQRALLKEYDRAGEKDGYVYEEVAECLLSSGQPAEAAKYFEMAHDELSKDHSLSTKEPTRLERLKNLGKSRES